MTITERLASLRAHDLWREALRLNAIRVDMNNLFWQIEQRQKHWPERARELKFEHLEYGYRAVVGEEGSVEFEGPEIRRAR